MKTVWANTVIRNEERFIWYSIMSVIDCVDKILIYDLGSTDNTVNIIKSIKSKKIKLKQFPQNRDMISFAFYRQKMLEETKSDWVLILDGDEIWPDKSIQLLRDSMEKANAECLVVPTLMLLGDIYHYQESIGGDYHIAGQIGHYNLRAIDRKIPGLHVEIHPNDKGLLREGFFDGDGNLVYERKGKFISLLNYAPYLHASHLKRSRKDKETHERSMRFKYEIGIPFPKDFEYPKVFFMERPALVPKVTNKMSASYMMRALAETPLKRIKRRIKI